MTSNHAGATTRCARSLSPAATHVGTSGATSVAADTTAAAGVTAQQTTKATPAKQTPATGPARREAAGRPEHAQNIIRHDKLSRTKSLLASNHTARTPCATARPEAATPPRSAAANPPPVKAKAAKVKSKLPKLTGKGKQKQANHTSSQYDENVGFEAYDLHSDKKFDWTTLLACHGDAVYDIPAQLRAEQIAAQNDTPFSRELAIHLEKRGHELIRRSSFNLPVFLQTLEADHSQRIGAWIYITASRGLDLVEADVEVLPSESENYSSATCPDTGYPKQVARDIQRLYKHEFVLPWSTLAAEIGSTKVKPTIVHSLGAVMRKGKVRIVIDASSSQHKHSINDLMSKEGKTCFSTVGNAMRSMSQRGSCSRADLSDAFLQTPLSARSCELCGFKWVNEKGETEYWAYRVLGFGFAIGPRWQQTLAEMVMRATVRMCAEAGCNTTAMPEYGTHQKIATPARRGHQLTAMLALLDDFAFIGTSRKVTHFAWIKFLHLTGRLGMVVSPSPGKTDPPATAMLYLGIEINLRDMTAKLHEERVTEMRARLKEVHNMKVIKKKQLQSVIGVLVFAATIIKCGRPAYSHLLQLLRDSRGARKITMDAAARSDIRMWLELLTKLNSKSVICGVRMPASKWHIWTDASYTGWSWTAGFGCIDYGVWPESWKLRMGQSKYSCIWICECEILTVAFAMRYLAPLAANSRVTIHIDNLPVVQMLKKHSSVSSRCCAVVAEIEWCCATYNVELSPVHCRTYDNVIADAGSRYYEEGFDVPAFNKLVSSWRAECIRRCPTEPEECAMVRPDLLELWRKHIVKLDLWQDAPTKQNVDELERLLPHYLKANEQDTAWTCQGKQPEQAREHELRNRPRSWLKRKFYSDAPPAETNHPREVRAPDQAGSGESTLSGLCAGSGQGFHLTTTGQSGRAGGSTQSAPSGRGQKNPRYLREPAIRSGPAGSDSPRARRSSQAWRGDKQITGAGGAGIGARAPASARSSALGGKTKSSSRGGSRAADAGPRCIQPQTTAEDGKSLAPQPVSNGKNAERPRPDPTEVGRGRFCTNFGVAKNAETSRGNEPVAVAKAPKRTAERNDAQPRASKKHKKRPAGDRGAYDKGQQ